ncbi:hypothetical protein [Phytohabitans houttuyneae]|uniref:Uncharacterized protein n=1 Tax=Phytohabitans houttuyneae TaxID=1076126 RepID=A0A6V8K4E5_9ACTN|nr:hypothetical protein [Phytohabitans houttuyneae]GFJ78604.1 hypothetical protein Phou_027840 [Phytohabitans houttuyneae]
MNDILGWIVTVAALAVALFCLVAAIRDRPPHVSHFAGVALVEVAALVLTVVAVIAMIGGEHPTEVGTFVGYLFTFLALPPVAIALARLEPTRWGSVILTVAMLVMPVLVARLNQIWEATGA